MRARLDEFKIATTKAMLDSNEMRTQLEEFRRFPEDKLGYPGFPGPGMLPAEVREECMSALRAERREREVHTLTLNLTLTSLILTLIVPQEHMRAMELRIMQDECRKRSQERWHFLIPTVRGRRAEP